MIDKNGREWFPASRCDEFDPETHDFYWNEDYTFFYPSRLLWWDDASYRAYQSDCGDSDCNNDEAAAYVPQKITPVTVDDDLPF